MNPFDLSKGNKKTLKKKHFPSAESPASSSSDLLTKASTSIRKPFYQIYLEEISRKPKKIACRVEIDAKEVGYLGNRNISKITKKSKKKDFNLRKTSSCDDLTAAMQQLQLSDKSNSDEDSKLAFKASTTISPLKPLSLTQSYVLAYSKPLDPPLDSIQPPTEPLKTPEKSLTHSELISHSKSEQNIVSPLVLSRTQNISVSASDLQIRDYSIREYLTTKTNSEKTAITASNTQNKVDILTLKVPGANENLESSKFAGTNENLESTTFTLKSSPKKDPEFVSLFKSSSDQSSEIDIFKPLDIPSFVKSPLKPPSKSQLKPSSKSQLKTKSQIMPSRGTANIEPPSTTKYLENITQEVPDDVREYYTKHGAIPKNFALIKRKSSDEYKPKKSVPNIPEENIREHYKKLRETRVALTESKTSKKYGHHEYSPYSLEKEDNVRKYKQTEHYDQSEFYKQLAAIPKELVATKSKTSKKYEEKKLREICKTLTESKISKEYEYEKSSPDISKENVKEYYKQLEAMPKKLISTKSKTSKECKISYISEQDKDMTEHQAISEKHALTKSKTSQEYKHTKSIPDISAEEKDVKKYKKKHQGIPKKLASTQSKSFKYTSQKSIPNISKAVPVSDSKFIGIKSSKTAKKVPSIPLKDIVKRPQISPYSWKLKKDAFVEKIPKPTLGISTKIKKYSYVPKTIVKKSSSKIPLKKCSKKVLIKPKKSDETKEAALLNLESLVSLYEHLYVKTSTPQHEFHEHESKNAAEAPVDPELIPLDHSETQSVETSSSKHSSTTDKKPSITEEKASSLGDFNHDLGEAILDSIFFGHNYDFEDALAYAVLKDLTEDDGTPEEKDTLQLKSPKISQSGGQGGGADSPDLEFVYDDTDTHGNEIAELYSYTEQPELQLNVKAFEDQMESYNLPPSWQCLPVEKRKSVIMKLLDQLEVSKKPLRMRSARCLLYIAQGCWAEMQSDTEQQHWARINCMLLYQLGAFSAFTDLLNIEIENSTAAHVAMRKIAVSLADSQDLRVILSVLYTITEVIRNEKATDNSEYKNDIDAFCFEIGNSSEDDLLVIKLLGMVTRFCSGAAPHFPMKKVLLLLWKLILVSLGGMTTLKDLKAEKRKRAGLTPQDEDTMEIAKTMRSSSPPASASDLLEAQNQKRNTRPFRRSLMKQSSLDDQETLGMEMETTMGNDNGDDLADMTEYDERRPSDNSEVSQMYNNHNINMYNRQMSPPPQHDILPRGLPWKPKVRQKDIDMFLDGARQKFLGYSLPGDQATLFGLPEPIHEGVKILKEHVYTSLAELQIQKEEEVARNPLSTEEDEIDLTPAEMLYQAMLPNLPQYMIALLKILLAAAPTSKAKTDSINIMADVLPEEMPMTVLQSMKLGIDVNRHKEIIVKAVSAVLLLLLKHFKLNHIYQFEFMSQHLVFANCIPLVLKFFNQNIMAYVGAKNVIPILDFPSCVIGDQPELTAESLEIGDAASFSWRNMFSCINLLRILNKLTKWKHSRIMMLVVFKSAPILKRTLKVRHAMTQLYVLKLLKMQTKYLGRQWRKSNMKTISAIYQKVRHRLNDDWAYGNDLDARPWDFQAEECALRASVDRFNNRRYTLVNESDFEPVDNCLSSVLGANHELSENFKNHYSLWLEQEVFGTPIEWERLLLNDNKP